MHAQYLKGANSDWNRIYSPANEGFLVCKYKLQSTSTCNEWQEGMPCSVIHIYFPLYISAEMKGQGRGLFRTPMFYVS